MSGGDATALGMSPPGLSVASHSHCPGVVVFQESLQMPPHHVLANTSSLPEVRDTADGMVVRPPPPRGSHPLQPFSKAMWWSELSQPIKKTSARPVPHDTALGALHSPAAGAPKDVQPAQPAPSFE